MTAIRETPAPKTPTPKTSAPKTPAPDDDAALTPSLRWMANLLGLNALCARHACRRAQACRGEPRDCLVRYAPLVPEEAREGVRAMLEGRSLRLSFDEVRNDVPEVDDLIEWRQRVDACKARGKALHSRRRSAVAGNRPPPL